MVQNIKMQFGQPLTGEFLFELVNQAGQVVLQKSARLNNNMNVELEVGQVPVPGIYVLRARQVGSPKVYTGKLLFRR